MKVYFSIKDSNGVETVDELDSKDFDTMKEFIQEKKRLTSEYQLCGMNVYTSQRCDKTW
jgi:hypothetical protein